MDILRLLHPEHLAISTEIAPEDAMYGGNVDHYLGVGHSALRCISAVLLLAGTAEPARVLDLPCGHGRVTRALRAAFPNAHITVGDLDPNAVDYCGRSFGATGVVCEKDARAIRLPGPYDLVWCGSLFTHLPREKWATFLLLFERVLAPGGVLVFTTHGRKTDGWLWQGRTDKGLTLDQMYGLTALLVDELRSRFARDGFGYVDYPEQKGYGLSLSALSFVVGLVKRVTHLRLVACLEHGWDEHQDVIGCMKPATAIAHF